MLVDLANILKNKSGICYQQNSRWCPFIWLIVTKRVFLCSKLIKSIQKSQMKKKKITKIFGFIIKMDNCQDVRSLPKRQALECGLLRFCLLSIISRCAQEWISHQIISWMADNCSQFRLPADNLLFGNLFFTSRFAIAQRIQDSKFVM